MSALSDALAVATGGALGALGRWSLGLVVVQLGGAAPVGTLLVNLLGCLLIGVAKACVDLASWGSEPARLFVFTGLIGAFTTFSTFQADAVSLWRGDGKLLAAAYFAASLVGGICLFVVGWHVAQRALS